MLQLFTKESGLKIPRGGRLYNDKWNKRKSSKWMVKHSSHDGWYMVGIKSIEHKYRNVWILDMGSTQHMIEYGTCKFKHYHDTKSIKQWSMELRIPNFKCWSGKHWHVGEDQRHMAHVKVEECFGCSKDGKEHFLD